MVKKLLILMRGRGVKERKKFLDEWFWLQMLKTRPMWGMLPVRIIFGTVLFFHGLSRLLVMRGDVGSIIESLPGEVAFVILVVFSVVELVCGAFIIPGFMARFVGFGIMIEMILSIFLERIPLGFEGDIRLSMLLFAISTMVFFSGAGRFSVDRAIARKLLDKFPNKKRELYILAETPYTKWYE